MFYVSDTSISWWIPCKFENSVYSAVLRWNILFILIIFGWLIMLFSSTTSLQIFCLLDMIITDQWVLSPSTTIIVDLSISPWSSTSFCLMYFGALLLNAYTFRISLFSWRIDSFIIMWILFFHPENFPCSEACIVWT